MQTIVYQCDTAMPAQKLPNCCYILSTFAKIYAWSNGPDGVAFGYIA